MSWEDEDFTPTIPGQSKAVADSWEDEDNTIKVKASWEDEDVEVKKPEKPKTAPGETKAKPAAKAAKKAPAAKAAASVSTGDPLADKMREQRLVEESDYQNTRDMFGIDEKSQPTEEDFDFNSFQPKTEQEFEQLATQLVKKLSTHETSFHYTNLVKSICKQLCSSFARAEDIKEVISVLNVLVNDRLKSDKPKPKKKGPAGATAGKKTYKDAFDDLGSGGGYDDNEYDDFM